MANDWQSSLSFSDRIAATTKISTAYRVSNPDVSASEATKYGREEEADARLNATSSVEYQEKCDQVVKLLSTTKPSIQAEGIAKDDVLAAHPATEESIGRYIHAIHYKDGLTAEIFKAVLAQGPQNEDKPALVALKVTTLSNNTPPHDAAKEARLLSYGKGKHIIPLIETFQQPGGRLVMAFPFMPYDLNMLLHYKQITRESGRAIMKNMFSGLAHLHSLGIIHRDIKPTNILLPSPQGPAYLADLGIAWSSNDRASEPVDEKILDVGTTCYRPPELLFGNQRYDETLDMWAIGCVAAQIVCLNGNTLFDAGDLGSELALIKSIFETLGTPDLEAWPEAASLPDWDKMNFRQYPGKSWADILPTSDNKAIDLVEGLVVYESSRRLTAEVALEHKYFE